MRTSAALLSTVGLGLLVAACAGTGKTEDAAPAAAAAAPEADRAREASRKKLLEEFSRKGLDTAPEDAQFLRILVASSGARRGVEVGSYQGYGAIHMGMALERKGGHLFTLEIDPKTAETCRANLRQAGLEKTVTCITGDALKTLPALEGEFDLVFLDAKKDDYLKYLKLIEPKLKPGAVIVADNTIRHAKAMQDYLDYVFKNPDYDSVTIRASMQKNDGMTVTYKIR